MMSLAAFERQQYDEALDDAREDAIHERAEEILTERCTVSEVVYMEALENLQLEAHARYIASCIRMARTVKRKVEIDEQHMMLGERVAKAVAAYMLPEAEHLARESME